MAKDNAAGSDANPETPLAALETTAIYMDASVRYALNFNWGAPAD